MLRLLVLFGTLLIWGQLSAQALRLKLRSDSDSILLGDRCVLRCEWRLAQDAELDRNSLDYEETLKSAGWEVLETSPLEESRDSNTWTLSRSYVVTAWDAGYKLVPQATGALRTGETFYSDSLRVKIVHPILADADTLVVQKEALVEAAQLSDYWDWYGKYTLFAAIGLFFLWALKSFLRSRKNPHVPMQSAEDWALEALKKLQEARYLENGNYVQFHAQVSWLMRSYLARRFPDCPALTLPVSEILQGAPGRALPYALVERVREVLETADLIKFAKASPLAPANSEAISVLTQLIHQKRGPQG